MSAEHRDEAMNEIDPTQHEKLCAYIFDELEGAEREAFEAELAQSPALRAEREQIEATVGFVQSNVSDEALSPEVQNTLRAAAQENAGATKPPIPAGWRFLRGGGGVLRIAAGFLVVLGGALVWNVFQEDTQAPTLEVAMVDSFSRTKSAKDAPVQEAEEQVAGGRLARRVSGDQASDDQFALRRDVDKLAAATAGAPARQDADRLKAIGYGEAAAAPSDALAEASEEVQSGMFIAADPKKEGRESKGTTSFADQDGREADLVAKAVAPPAAAAGGDANQPAEEPSVDPQRVEQLMALGYAGVSDADPSRERVVEAQDLTFRALGSVADERAESNVIAKAAPAPVSREGLPGVAMQQPSAAVPQTTVAQGRYRGPGDVGAPGTGSSVEGALRALGYIGGENLGARREVEAARRDVSGFKFEEADGWFIGRRQKFKNERGRANAPVYLDDDGLVRLCGTVLRDCRIRPNERPRDMFFRCWGDNPFVMTSLDTRSTFSVDVDTASYTLARSYLNRAQLPPREAVRTEEFVNYFKADRPAPAAGEVFDIGMELAPNAFNSDPNAWMLRVTVRGQDVDPYERHPLALTFVIDVSGSMREGNRLELVKRSLTMLTNQLSGTDSIAIVAFNREARLVSHMTSAANRGVLLDAIAGLRPDGGTNVGGGLNLGYRVAAEALTPNAVNRVILLSDGVGNIGTTDSARILDQVRGHRAQGIYLNTIGVGMGNHNDTFLEQLANAGDGLCNYIDSDREAMRTLVDGFTGAFQPIARDVKIQMAFNPTQVARWRQLGYENRKLAHADFRNDAVDAGEVNAGHQVTALYELILQPRIEASSEPLASVKVRYKAPFSVDTGNEDAESRAAAEVATEIQRQLVHGEIAATYAATSLGYRRAVLVAQFAEFLRRSVHARDDSVDEMATLAHALRPELRDPDFDEFCVLVEMARPLLRRSIALYSQDRIGQLLDELTRLHYLEGVRDQLDGEDANGAFAKTRQEGAEYMAALEAQITELLKRKYEAPKVMPAGEER